MTAEAVTTTSSPICPPTDPHHSVNRPISKNSRSFPLGQRPIQRQQMNVDFWRQGFCCAKSGPIDPVLWVRGSGCALSLCSVRNMHFGQITVSRGNHWAEGVGNSARPSQHDRIGKMMFPAVWPYIVTPHNFERDSSVLHLNSEAVRDRFAQATMNVKRELQTIEPSQTYTEWVEAHAAIINEAAKSARITDPLERKIFQASCACWMDMRELYDVCASNPRDPQSQISGRLN